MRCAENEPLTAIAPGESQHATPWTLERVTEGFRQVTFLLTILTEVCIQVSKVPPQQFILTLSGPLSEKGLLEGR